MNLPLHSATLLAHLVKTRQVSAEEIALAVLDLLASKGKKLNAVTDILTEEALIEARSIDSSISRNRDPGPLAGVPYGIKDLFDLKGKTTLAGSIVEKSSPPAKEDASLIRRLRANGAVVTTRQMMDEYAYGFTTENFHHGSTRNPHAPDRVAGGSSGGSAACVAAGILPFSLGSDTNGSIRVPASFCGTFGLKPTFGRLSRHGTFPFVSSLDHIGLFASSIDDLALVYDSLQGPDPADPACWASGVERVSPSLRTSIRQLRIARLGGYFQKQQFPEVRKAVDHITELVANRNELNLPEVTRARSAAFLISASEGGRLHLDNLRSHRNAFDPNVRDRLIAGACVPASWYLQAQRFRAWFRRQVLDAMAETDILIAPATPCPATLIGQKHMTLDGIEMPVRPNLGIFSQPISLIGLPVLTVPVFLPRMPPLGVQLIAKPKQEHLLFRLAAVLEREGITARKPRESTLLASP